MAPSVTDAPELVITNFHRRFTGVSSTADAVLSRQQSQFRVCLVGNRLPQGPPPVTYRQALRLCRQRPPGRPFSVWHVRRNLEMAAALFARDVLRLPIRILFTSAAQRLHSAIPRRLIARMDAVAATTPQAAAFVPGVAGVIPHGVDTDRFFPAEDRQAAWQASGLPGRRAVGIVGRVRSEKGTDLFVEAMLEQLPHRPDWTALIIGRAKPSEQAFEHGLKQRIEAAGLARRVLFLGERPPEEIPALVRSLSLLVAPARYEGFGMTVLEAMASGVAVVAADTGVYGTAVTPQCGRVVPVGQPAPLAAAIGELLNRPELLESMGRRGRAAAEQSWSLAGEAAGYAALIQRMWSNGQTQRPSGEATQPSGEATRSAAA